MILRRETMPPTARRMLVAIPVVVVPDRANVAGVGFEEESGDGVDASRLYGADRTH
jgi:hypothetical protein